MRVFWVQLIQSQYSVNVNLTNKFKLKLEDLKSKTATIEIVFLN